MNPLDISIIAAMIFFVVRGIFRGFFREIGSLAGVISGLWLANMFQPHLTSYLKAYLPSVKFLPLISFGAIFIIVFITCSLLGMGLRFLVKKAFLGWADRVLGAGLAVFKGLIITYFAIILITFFVPSKAPLIAESRMAPVIISSYQSLVNLISPGAYQKLREKLLGKNSPFNENPGNRGPKSSE